MNIKEIRINNFRSIKSMTIPVKLGKTVFVGPNESGKSNILKAISLLSNDINPTYEDIRDKLPEDDLDDNSRVQFIISLDNEDIQECVTRFKNKIISKNESIIYQGTELISVFEFFSKNNELLYTIDIDDQRKFYQYWTYKKDYTLAPNIKKIINNDSKTKATLLNFGIELSEQEYINIEDLEEVDKSLFAECVFDNIGEIYFKIKKELFSESFPQSIMWHYNETDVLPSRIEIDKFIANPDVNYPLKSIFQISSINNIEDEINIARKKPNGIQNLFRLVSDRISKHIHEVWPASGLIRIVLTANGNHIEIGVEDAFNLYDFSRRSDGFKRFLSFILSISAKHHNGELKNSFVIIDEPDIGLHPESSKSLNKELINLSKNNYLFYSTHSIFMIDKENIENNYIVSKNKEITGIDKVESSTISNEEVIYNSIGYSIFEHIKTKNIIFEGWKDSELFKFIIENRIYPEISDHFLNYGKTYSTGVKDVPLLVSLLELTGKDYIILTDSDQVAIEKKNKFPDKRKWITYQDVFPEKTIITMEDFFTIDYLIETINKIFSSQGGIPPLQLISPLDSMNQVEEHLNRNKIPDKKNIKLNIKNELINNISPEFISEKYYEYLKFVSEIF